MIELAVLIPTRGRPDNIRKVISAWDFTNAWDVAEMIVIVDADDPELAGYQALFEEARNPSFEDQPLFSIVVMNHWMPMVHKLNQTAEAVALSRTYFALGFAGDDHLPQTINWAQTYLGQLHELGTGMVYGDDGYQGRNLSSEWAITADVVRTLGGMVPAPVEHMYSDVSLLDLMDQAGAVRYLPQVRIEHMHPIVKKAPEDDQYKRVNSREQFRKDELAYNAWTRAQKQTDLDAVRALRPGSTDEPPARAKSRPVRSVRSPQIQRSGPTRRKAATMPSTRFPFTREFKQVRGATPDEIGMTLADFATRVPADQEIVELGVFQGRTALIMAWGAQQGDGAHVTGIDAWDLEGNTYGPPFNEEGSRAWADYRIKELGYVDRITLVKAFASDAAADWAEGLASTEKGVDPGVFSNATPWAKRVGLLFVDDDHSYAGARQAIEQWAPNLAEGATIAVDDYGHPDWPGVKEAVDALVSEGFLAPIEIYHDRLAVTRLVTDPERVTAITSEGVSPLPVAPVSTEPGCQHPDCILDHPHAGPAELPIPEEPEVDDLFQEPDMTATSDTQVSTDAPPFRATVHEGELAGAVEGTPITELTIPQMKTLARRRNIILGIRKDKRDLIVQALIEGK